MPSMMMTQPSITSDSCPNDMTPQVAQALQNLPQMLSGTQDPQLQQQTYERLNSNPSFALFVQFMGLVGAIISRYQLKDVESQKLLVDPQYRQQTIQWISNNSKVPESTKKKLLNAHAKLENAIRSSDNVQVMDALRVELSQVSQQLPNDPRFQKSTQEMKQLQTASLLCRAKNVFKKISPKLLVPLKVVGFILGVMLPLLIWYIAGGVAGAVTSVGMMIPVFLLHLLMIAVTVASESGIFAALTGSALKLLKSATVFCIMTTIWGHFFLEYDLESMGDYVEETPEKLRGRWQARHQGRSYYLPGRREQDFRP